MVSVADEEQGHVIRDSASAGLVVDRIITKPGDTIVHGTSPTNREVSEFMRNLDRRKPGDVALVMIRKDSMGAYFILRIRHR